MSEQLADAYSEALARIAELEAERERLRSHLRGALAWLESFNAMQRLQEAIRQALAEGAP